MTPPPTNLTEGRWFLHSVNGEAVPALVAERIIGITAEETHIDSATIDVTLSGTWTQRVFVRVLYGGAVDREEMFLDQGTWTREPASFAFVSSVRSRAFSAQLTSVGTLISTETLLSWTGAPTLTGTYGLTVP